MQGLVRIVAGRMNVLEPFLARVQGMNRISRLTLVSPWMTHCSYAAGDTRAIILWLAANRIAVRILTRPPDPGSDHFEFIEDISRLPLAEVIYVPDLHAKLYLCEAGPYSFALITSANLYKWTTQTFEVGVIINLKGAAETLLDELLDIVGRLRLSENRVWKKRLDLKKGG